MKWKMKLRLNHVSNIRDCLAVWAMFVLFFNLYVKILQFDFRQLVGILLHIFLFTTNFWPWDFNREESVFTITWEMKVYTRLFPEVKV